MNLVFVEPAWLWLLLLVPLPWFLPRRASDRWHAAIRSLVALLLILALARPALLTDMDHSYQVLVWDRSESVSEATVSAVEAWEDRLPESARVRAVVLGGPGAALPDLADRDPVFVEGSSIGEALHAAARLIPEGALGAVTVVSDGLATDPRWGDAVRELVERKIPVHTVSVPRRSGEVYPSAIHGRPPLRVGQSAKVMVDVQGSAEEVVVSLWSGEELLARSKPLACDKRAEVELGFEPSQAGVLEVTAKVEVLSGADGNPSNNEFASALAVQDPVRALYLSGRLANSAERLQELLGPGVELTQSSEAVLKGLAENPGQVSSYDLVMIDDRPAEELPAALQEVIVEAVQRDGVGLFYAGGKGVFGTGGYYSTPVASILPVEMVQKEEKRDPSTTLVVIIDTSGSMGGERVQLAKECARLAIRRLLPHDKVGIVEFYGTKQWAAPIQSAANAIDIQRAINRMDAGGGTVILPAIEEAFYAMQNVQTRYKHVLVLTDGGVESGDFESLMRRMAAKGINVSTVLVGSDAHSEFLVNMANWGKGHFYSASSRFNIPEVLLKQPSTSKIPPYRPGEHPVSMGGPSGWWGEIPRPDEPRITGYVETRLRPGAQVVVETEAERHPVLASWRFGLGRVSAFTTEPVGEGTAPWQEWDGYGAWLMRALARTSREHPQPFAYTIERSPTGARIVAKRLTPQAHVPMAERIDADGAGRPLVFRQRSPDVFTATVLDGPAATIHLRAGAENWPGRMAHLVSPAWHAVAPEHNVDPAKAIDLALLASATGGRSVSLEMMSALNSPPGGTGTATDLRRLWPLCLILALLAYFGDLLFRRWPGFPSAGTTNIAVLGVILGFGLIAAPEVSAEISPALEGRLRQTLEGDPFQFDDGALYAAALLEDESLDPLLERLDALIKEDGQSFDAIWLAASLKWRYGLLDDALGLFQRAAELRPEPLPLFRVAQLLDSRGKTKDAVEQYLHTLRAGPDAALAGRIQLRLALLKSTEADIENVEEDLAAYARKQDQAFRNRAGVVLALTGKPGEALDLYRPSDDPGQAFKQLIRIAEWAMAAEDMARARESAWGALRSARLKRDRRYALTVLAEAYRKDRKLDDLTARFAATPDLSEEARMAWIDLLREQGGVAQALELFRQAKAGGGDGFTADMCREMLAICREAGRDDLLIRNFREMIEKEPRRLEWRSGLCRFYLERGERAKGMAVWASYRNVARRSDWLAAAGALMDLGLDDLAREFAEELVRIGRGKEQLAALQFVFDLHKSRGRQGEMQAVLQRMDELAAPDASERARLAESWEQLGRQDKAVEVLEKLRDSRGPDNFSSDLETRLAWLYSETGAEEKAYEAWKHVWLRIDSPGRRRYIEDRLMATASRLGKLADIAIELEEKLAEGTADKRDSALLVRLYTKVGDPVSASEIIHDFMKQSGGTEIRMLEEQARVYVMCNDYYHYEKTLRRLMKLDPEGAPEYFTQLAMSALERGRNDEARAILTEMRNLETNPASAEFEAGVLKIAGMHEEATAAYWRGIARNPDRIDAYLLLGRSLQTLKKGPQAAGLFQYLVENAGKDDLFTIAIDGMLNMNNPRQGSRLAPETLQWARRAILERLAARDDKVYLFQLLGDVSEDLRDQQMMIRALAETLPIAGERRTAQLRELMELARVGTRDKAGVMRFGRRLVGMGEIIPPQVYLELGSVFLESGDVRNAARTFDHADRGLDEGGYQRKVAATFEKKRYIRSALRSYEQLLITTPDDPGVLVKAGELRERLGRDAEAAIAYRRALEVLVDGEPLFSFKQAGTTPRTSYVSRNVDRFDKYYLRVLTGFLAASDPGGTAVVELIDDSLQALRSDLKRVDRERAAADPPDPLARANVPRIVRRSNLIRRLALADGHLDKARTAEQILLGAFPEDDTLLRDICRTWDSWGYGRAARDLIATVPGNPGRDAALQSLGHGNDGGVRQIVQLILNGDREGAREGLRDIEKLLGEGRESADLNMLFTIARYLEDPVAVERLTRLVISRTPRTQRLFQSISMLNRAFPSLDQPRRDRLIAHVERLIGRDGSSGGRSAWYYYPRLKRLTGRDLKLPLESIQPEVEKMLARGGHYNRYVASMFSFLNEEDYRTLLREAYRKAKAADRLAIVFGLVRQYPGKMDAGTEATFIELAEEAAEASTDDPLKVYRSCAPNRHYGATGNDANAGFEARLLEKLAEGKSEEQQLDYLTEQVQAWDRAGDANQVMATAGKALRLAVKNDKAFSRLLSLQERLPSSCQGGFLAAMDRIAGEDGNDIALEKMRLQLVRQARSPDRILAALRESVRKFPEDPALREELRRELDMLGRHFEAIEVLEGLAKLEPDNPQHRADLRTAWNRLAHPIKARAIASDPAPPRPEAGVRGNEPAGAPPVTRPGSAPTAGFSPETARAKEDTQEVPLDPPSTQTIKKHYDAGDLDAARLDLRRLWRRFAALDQASRSRFFRLPGQAHSRYYEWPGAQPGTVKKAPASTSPDTRLGGLKAFLALNPRPSPFPRRTSGTPGPTIFTAIGSEEFAARELRTWLRTFDPGNYKAPLFDMLVRETVKQQIAGQGVEPFVKDALTRFNDGSLAALGQQALISALELHPEAGGEAAGAFLDRQKSTLDPGDMWKVLRLARCLLKRGDEEAALSLYRWCAANVSHSRHVSYNSVNVTANLLVEELRSNFGGAGRIRAFEAVLPLVTADSRSSTTDDGFADFILSAWASELSPHEVRERCPEICRQVVRDGNANGRRSPDVLRRATLFLAAGGETNEALAGLEALLAPQVDPQPSRYSRPGSDRGRYREYLLQQLLPEDMTAWTNADRWLSGIATSVRTWQADGKLPSADAVQIQSLVAVRQHQNGFEEAAQATLAEIGKLSCDNPEAALWFSDAAEITGNQQLAQEVAIESLNERRLPLVRVAPLMRAVAEERGYAEALSLAEATLEYTWEPGFLETMAELATTAGDEETARVWKDRLKQVRNPGVRPAPAAEAKAADETYRELLLASRAGEHEKALELGEVLLGQAPDHPEIATALHLAAKSAIATANRERAVPLLRKIARDHPGFAEIEEVRFRLAESLSGTRALEECIRQCRENLAAAPESSGADYFRFLIPQSQFRLWKFREAEKGLQAFLAEHPESAYAGHARRYLDRINPAWDVDANGVAAYSGKFEKDHRFEAAMAALPEHIKQGREMIRERLGVDIDFTGTVNFIFRDAGVGNKGGLMAETFTICRDDKPVTVMQFYAEHVVTDPESYRLTVIHEMKHAGFKVLMGRAYDDLPDWIVEGLAQWAADQGASRMRSALNSETFAGRDPLSLLNGVAHPAHDLGDYLEDILAFEWLEEQNPGSLQAFGRGLVQGEPWRELLAATSGLETGEALRQMDRYCREQVRARLGEAGEEALALRDTQIAKGKEGADALNEWLREEGSRGFAEWVDKNPGHVLEPVMRFYAGRGLILTGRFAPGRERLREVSESLEAGTLRDDALFYEGYALQQEKRMEEAARTFGVLLRDYSWSNSAAKVRGSFEPAGPELQPGPGAN